MNKIQIIEILEKYEFDPAKGWDSEERHIDSTYYSKIADELLQQINLSLGNVSGSLPGDVPLFIDWLDKYYTHAGNDDLYKRKDNGTIEIQSKLYKDYKRAYKLGNDW